MEYLTIYEVELIHDDLIDKYGGKYGILNPNSLDSTVHCPQQTFEGNDLYDTIEKKAAILAYSLLRNHPFVDGNKRTAQKIMLVFLEINGYEFNKAVDINEHEQILYDIESRKIDFISFVRWIGENLVQI